LKLPEIEFRGLKLQLGLGGIHSVDEPGIFKAEDGMILLDMDVTSFYPSSMILFDLCPEHLDLEIFKNLLINLKEERNQYKKRKKEKAVFAALEYGLKTGNNSLFGLFGYDNFMLFDPMITYKVTVNNQLWLMKLIEMLLLRGHQIISANTDGILLFIPESSLDDVRSISREWEAITGFQLEETQYDLYVRSDVNNYIARKLNGEIKLKGRFVPMGAYLDIDMKLDMPRDPITGKYKPIKGLLKGFKFPIVAISLIKYYLEGIPIQDTIKNHRDIFDFCFSQKTAKKFTNHLLHINRCLILHGKHGKELVHPKIQDEVLDRQTLQPTLRFFVSLPQTNDDGSFQGHIVKKISVEQKTVQVCVKAKQVIPAQFETEKRINPETGRLKTFKEKIRDKEIIPAEFVTEIQNVTKEIVFAGGNFITLFMDFFDVEDWDEYNIDFDFYISEAEKEIKKIGRI